ncbi:MAG: transporter substrate-binding domain-containing protein [Sedimentibacter sp.]|uniref:transporter substrate-binding domain-containing protein n=1 Tax=Sedimentibacter sp. TaxID=1960295 RepID=UPI00315834E7
MSRKINVYNATVIFALAVAVLFIKYEMGNRQYLTQNEIQWLNEQDSIVYAANENAPPLRFVDDKDNQYKGVVVDYMNQLSLELGVDIQTVPMKWEDALESLKSGETHICDMFVNEERSRYYLFTDPIYNLRTVLLARMTAGTENKGISSMTIATEKGDYANTYLEEHYPQANLVYTRNVEEGLDLFMEGTVDAVVGDEPLITYLLVERGQNNNSEYNIQVIYEEEVVLAVAKTKPELVSILNKAIGQINKKGQLEKIQQKWFGISTPLITNRTDAELVDNIILSVAAALIVFTVILLNNMSLKRQVKKRTSELEANRNELRTIFDGITEYMVVVDENKKILNANKSFIDFLGLSRELIEGEDCTGYLDRFCEDCSGCMVEETLSGQKTIKNECMCGNEIYEISFQLLRGAENAVLITIKNITIEKISRNQMLQTNKMIAVGQLAAGMAHEIRNPLGIIRTQSYLLRLCDKIDETMSKSLDFIDSSVNRAGTIIENILSFSRLSGNEKELVNLPKAIEKILEMHNDIIKKENIKVSFVSSIQEELRLSAESIEHIVLNLVSNSVDAMEEGGELNISADIENNSIVIRVSDTGCGIEEENLGNIFNPFFTTKELGKGTGLGLFIVYSEVEKIGGKIQVSSKVGQGTTFEITIPMERNADIDGTI